MWPLRCFICGVLPLRLLLIAVVLDSPDGVIAQETGELDFEVRTYNGTNNNLNYPLWGSVNITQVRAVISVRLFRAFVSLLRMMGKRSHFWQLVYVIPHPPVFSYDCARVFAWGTPCQIRAVASANYSDGVSSVSGSDRPTAR